MVNSVNTLFVYGSLRSGFRNPAYAYLTQYFHLLGEAVVKGLLYDNGEYPVAAATDEDKFITGELYQLNNAAEFSWAIGQLDDYEGLNTEEGETPLYKREVVIAYQDGKPIPSWIYWYNGTVTGLPVIPSGDVIDFLQQQNRPR